MDVEVSDGVSCVVGANGLGKSTFIAAINFGLCGRVPEPDETFRSSGEYFQAIRPFSSAFFEGRISESDRTTAEIELAFTVGEDQYHIIRGAFEPDELRFATLNGKDLGRFIGDKHTAAKRTVQVGRRQICRSVLVRAVRVSTVIHFHFR